MLFSTQADNTGSRASIHTTRMVKRYLCTSVNTAHQYGSTGSVCTDPYLMTTKGKAFHTRYRALGPELIPVYRQSARRLAARYSCLWPANLPCPVLDL